MHESSHDLAHLVLHVVEHSLMITAFVAVMMICVEYLNVLTQGALVHAIQRSRARQLLLAVLLGALPGCLGSFMVVTLYTHRVVSLGAVVACMIATSGDEAFVMLALFPGQALGLFAVMAAIGTVAGLLTDWLAHTSLAPESCDALVVHEGEAHCCFPRGEILNQIKHMTLARGTLSGGIALFVFAVAIGEIGPQEWDWIRVTLLLSGAFGLFVVLTVSEHFLEEHLWQHTVKEHVPRLLAWTLGALTVVAVLTHYVQAEEFVRSSRWLTLGAAGVLGMIPESGPHLVFVTMYDRGLIPLAILLASSIVQDGHGAIPLLAHAPRDFFKVKAINLGVGLLVGAVLLALS